VSDQSHSIHSSTGGHASRRDNHRRARFVADDPARIQLNVFARRSLPVGAQFGADPTHDHPMHRIWYQVKHAKPDIHPAIAAHDWVLSNSGRAQATALAERLATSAWPSLLHDAENTQGASR
jgi:hypothetical protein